MHKSRICVLLAVLCCLTGIPVSVSAAEVESGSVYCFTPADFSDSENFSGICILSLPEAGETKLGSRTLCRGDILTAEQAAQATFCPDRTEQDVDAQLRYLPVVDGHVGEQAVMTLSIRGKEDKAPIAEDSALETYKNLEVTGKLKVTDPEGQSLTFAIVRQPRRGTVKLGEDGSFTYTPKKNKVGIDSFTFTATDPAGKVSREATVTVKLLKPTEASQYTDTLGMDCRFAAEWMKNTGIFVGETVSGNPCFSPEKEVTRGEFLTMLVKTLDIPRSETVTYTGFSDEIPLWLQPYLAAALRAGLTEGLTDQEVFAPDSPITGSDAAILLTNATDREYTLTQETLTRSDAALLLYDCQRQALAGK